MSPLFYIVFIAISFASSFAIYFYPITNTYLRLFPIFLFSTLVVELIALYSFNRGKPAITLYNFFTSFEFLFYMFTLRAVIQRGTMKRIIFHTAWLFTLLLAVNFVFIQKISSFSATTYALGCLLITIICIYYFYELFQSSRSLDLTRQPMFWICVGLLFFYCCSFPIFGLYNYLNKAPRIIQRNLQTILVLLNVFLYSSFTIAFLCRIRVRNSMS